MTETARALAEQVRYRVGHLRQYLAAGDHSILGDQTRLYAVEFAFVLAAQALLNLAGHVCARRGLPTDGSYRGALEALAAERLLDPALAEQISGLPGSRNLLVHLYGKVDHARALADIRSGLDPLEEAARRLVAVVDRAY